MKIDHRLSGYYYPLKWIIIGVFLILSVGASKAADFEYPTLPEYATSVSGFIPKGWRLVHKVSGKLDSDSHSDIAFIIEYKDSVMESLPRRIDIPEKEYKAEYSKPLLLVIAFRTTDGKGYHCVEQNHTFILRPQEMGYWDAEQCSGLKITKDKVLHIFVHFPQNSEGEYKFRYRRKEFQLIGVETSHFGGGELSCESFNFLTRKIKRTNQRIDNDHATITWKELPPEPIRTFKTFLRPLTWDIQDIEII